MRVLGVDAGASKTFALIADGIGRILGFGQGGPGNHQTVGLERALGEIRRACEEALRQAEAAPPVEVGVFGLAGADLPMDFELLSPALEEMGLARRTLVKNDTLVALRAGLKRSWGVVVVCGTGFNAAGVAPDGREFRLPGLGPLSGDWGGAGDIALETVRLVCRAWDGRGRPTALTQKVLSHLGFPSVEALIAEMYRSQIPHYEGGFDPQRLLGLVPLVFEAALEGDEVAQDLVVRVGREVGLAVSAVIRHLGLMETDVEVVLAGGVFRGVGPLLIDTVTQVVHRAAPRARLVLPEFEPVVGAILLGLESLGVTVDEAVYASLRDSLPDRLMRIG